MDKILLVLLISTASDINAAFEKEINCMAQNIYHEARGEPILGQKAVASVTMNRVKSGTFPKTVCGVVKQPRQFSWVGVKQQVKIPSEIFDLAERYVLGYNKKMDVTNGSTHFHAKYVRPNWGFERTRVIGKHIFYRDKRVQIAY